VARAAADLVIRMPERIVPAAASSAVPSATVIATGSPEAPAATAAPATATSSATPAAIRQSSPTTKSYQNLRNAAILVVMIRPRWWRGRP